MSAAYTDDPLHVDARGGTATTDEAGWIRDLIRAVLFTSPGERVHRPDFGSGVLQLLFAPTSGELTTSVRIIVQAAVQQWLGHLIQLEDISADTDETTVTITVAYTIRSTGDHRIDQFSSAGTP